MFGVCKAFSDNARNVPYFISINLLLFFFFFAEKNFNSDLFKRNGSDSYNIFGNVATNALREKSTMFVRIK